jgi:DNA transposition AAA+ family ATPase
MKTEDYTFKRKVALALEERMRSAHLSDTKVANQLGDVSDTAINFIRNHKWRDNAELVSMKVFRKVASWLKIETDWNIVREDINYKKVMRVCEEAQTQCESFAISAPPGTSKTQPAEDYSRNKNVFFLACAAHWTKKVFLEKLLQAMGQRLITGEGLAAMCDRIVQKLNSMDRPLIIVDEADKLSDRIFQFFITFYNDTYTNCGFLFLGSVFFEIEVTRRVNENRQGYAEFFSRVGREFIHLKVPDDKRIAAICEANGLSDQLDIRQIVNTCKGDLRVVKRMVQNFKKAKKLAAPGQLQLKTELA